MSLVGYGWLSAGIIASAVCGSLLGHWYGYSRGTRDQVAEQNASEVKSLQSIITSSKELVIEANSASLAMRIAANARKKSDEQSTRELKNVLEKSAQDRRLVCDFDDDSMRILREARDRAADAAASGIRGRLPGSSVSKQLQ